MIEIKISKNFPLFNYEDYFLNKNNTYNNEQNKEIDNFDFIQF